MVNIETVSIILTGIGIIIAFGYYTLTVQNQNRTRQAQLFMQIYNRWTDTDFNENYIEIINREWDDYDDYYRKYGGGAHPRETAKQRTIGQYFEGIGVLVYRNLIDVSLVDDLMSSLLFSFWEKYGPVIKMRREASNTPQILEWTEYLYAEVRKVAERQHPEFKT
jgi:hypothetical protein